MTNTLCVIPSCGRPSDTPMCNGCWGVLKGCWTTRNNRHTYSPGLNDVEWVTTELGTTMARMDKVGGASVGRVGGAGELPMPVNLYAGEMLRELRGILGGWVRDLWETFGPHTQRCGSCGAHWAVGEPEWHDDDCPPGTWEVELAELRVDDEPVALANWLLRHPTWVQTHTAALELHEEVLKVVRAARRAIDKAATKTYLGRCSALTDGTECPEYLYAAEGEPVVKCPTCGTEHVTADRRQVMLDALNDEYAPAADLVCMVGSLGQRVTSSMIRNLKARGRIKAWVWDEQAGWWRPKTDADSDYLDLFRVGDVIDAVTNRYKREVS